MQQGLEAPPAAAVSLGERTRDDFPILHQEVYGKPLVYLDNAATSQKPTAVLEALDTYYRNYNSNVHRGVHALSAKATTAYEAAREKVAQFVNAASPQEIVFTRNASEGLNLVAYSWGMNNLKAGDEVILSVAEHHSNIVPWQLIAQRTGCTLKFVELTNDTQELDMQQLAELVSPRTKLVTLVHISNMLGCVAPAHRIVELAHSVGAKAASPRPGLGQALANLPLLHGAALLEVLLDCCQSVPNRPMDVQALGADWIVASSHKMCGPTGIGFLWGKQELLQEMPPWMGGGEMIEAVYLDHSTYAEPPGRFEAGTPAIAQAIGLGAACDYLSSIGMDKIHAYETELGGYLYDKVASINRVHIYGPPPSVATGRAALVSFNVEGLHPTDLSTILDQAGVAVRSGHMCTQPAHRYLGVSASLRASPYFYNTHADVDAFVDALKESIEFFTEMGL
ncbi:hypothetical protein N2152v2_011183 [Parachlorella kessleri]